MRLGLGSFAYAWSIGVGDQMPAAPMTALDLVKEAAGLGVHLVQIGDNLPLDGYAPAALDDLARQASALGVAIQVGMRGIDTVQVKCYIELAQRLGSDIVRTVVDTPHHHPDPDGVVAALRPIIPDLETAGITLAIENHDRFKAREVVHMLRRLESQQVGVCLDTVNSFGALEGPEVVIGSLAPWTVNLHVKDFAIARANHNMGFVIEGRPTGQGLLDVPWLLELLRAHGRDPDAIIELWPPPGATLEETIAKERCWAAESVTFMRQYLSD